MLKLTFVHALGLLALGVLGVLHSSNAPELRAFGVPGLFFGGATLFSAFFARRELRHGLAAAAFLSFLAFLTNGWSVVTTLYRGSYDFSHPGHRIATGVFLLCSLYLAAGIVAWKRARRAQAIAELEAG